MSRLPSEMIAILHAAPRVEKKREHILNLIHWRLVRGMTFTVEDILAAARMKTSRRYAVGVIDSVVSEGLAARMPSGEIGPAQSNKKGLRCMMRDYVRAHGDFSRREIWMGLPVAVPTNAIDRMLRTMVAAGEIEKVGRGRFRQPVARTLAMAA